MPSRPTSSNEPFLSRLVSYFGPRSQAGNTAASKSSTAANTRTQIVMPFISAPSASRVLSADQFVGEHVLLTAHDGSLLVDPQFRRSEFLALDLEYRYLGFLPHHTDGFFFFQLEHTARHPARNRIHVLEALLSAQLPVIPEESLVHVAQNTHVDDGGSGRDHDALRAALLVHGAGKHGDIGEHLDIEHVLERGAVGLHDFLAHVQHAREIRFFLHRQLDVLVHADARPVLHGRIHRVEDGVVVEYLLLDGLGTALFAVLHDTILGAQGGRDLPHLALARVRAARGRHEGERQRDAGDGQNRITKYARGHVP